MKYINSSFNKLAVLGTAFLAGATSVSAQESQQVPTDYLKIHCESGRGQNSARNLKVPLRSPFSSHTVRILGEMRIGNRRLAATFEASLRPDNTLILGQSGVRTLSADGLIQDGYFAGGGSETYDSQLAMPSGSSIVVGKTTARNDQDITFCVFTPNEVEGSI